MYQVVVNVDMYVNGDFYDFLFDVEKKVLEVVVNVFLLKFMFYCIFENGKVLKDLIDNYGVIFEDILVDYFIEYFVVVVKVL